MTWLDWLIVIVPMTLLIWLSFHSRKYARGVVDFLAAGRIAGRYVKFRLDPVDRLQRIGFRRAVNAQTDRFPAVEQTFPA